MKNLKDEIEGIDEFVEYFLDGVDCLVSLDSMDYEGERILRAGAKRALTSLIEQENEQFLIRFKDYVFKQPMNVKLWHEYIEQYLAERKE